MNPQQPGAEREGLERIISEMRHSVANSMRSWETGEVVATSRVEEWIEELAALSGAREQARRPRVICLCGSTRFIEQFAIKTWELELEGHIVLGCTLLPHWYCGVRDHFAEKLGVKGQRDEHHLRKIDLADEVLVLNIGGYIGESTRNEIAYAERMNKPVRYLETAASAPASAARQGPK